MSLRPIVSHTPRPELRSRLRAEEEDQRHQGRAAGRSGASGDAGRVARTAVRTALVSGAGRGVGSKADICTWARRDQARTVVPPGGPRGLRGRPLRLAAGGRARAPAHGGQPRDARAAAPAGEDARRPPRRRGWDRRAHGLAQRERGLRTGKREKRDRRSSAPTCTKVPRLPPHPREEDGRGPGAPRVGLCLRRRAGLTSASAWCEGHARGPSDVGANPQGAPQEDDAHHCLSARSRGGGFDLNDVINTRSRTLTVAAVRQGRDLPIVGAAGRSGGDSKVDAQQERVRARRRPGSRATSGGLEVGVDISGKGPSTHRNVTLQGKWTHGGTEEEEVPGATNSTSGTSTNVTRSPSGTSRRSRRSR